MCVCVGCADKTSSEWNVAASSAVSLAEAVAVCRCRLLLDERGVGLSVVAVYKRNPSGTYTTSSYHHKLKLLLVQFVSIESELQWHRADNAFTRTLRNAHKLAVSMGVRRVER